MKFFLPHAKDRKEEDKVYEGIKKFAEESAEKMRQLSFSTRFGECVV